MKPRSKREREVMDLSAKLPPISDKQRRYAEEHCHEGIGYMSGGLVWCTKCGCEFRSELNEIFMVQGTECVCPNCGQKLSVRSSTKRKIEESYYYMIVTTIGGWQVLRQFQVKRWMWRVTKYKDKSQRPFFEIREAVQNWIDERGREVIVARPRGYSIGYTDLWLINRPMEIRGEYKGYSYQADPYHINPWITYPYMSVLPILRRNGLKGKLPNVNMKDLMVKLLTDTRAETLIKAGQLGILQLLINRGGLRYWKQALIAIRNHYVVSDASLWVDLLDNLEYLGKDIHNAFYVCPKDLKEAHDHWMRRRRKVEAKRMSERKKKEMLFWEDEYRKNKQKFFGVEIADDRVVIKPIQSVKEMQEEGDEMHHCVAANGYYKRLDSLILSAKDKDGKRLETIEVNLKTMMVVQCFGKFNKTTEYHSEILNVMNKNMNKIAECV